MNFDFDLLPVRNAALPESPRVPVQATRVAAPRPSGLAHAGFAATPLRSASYALDVETPGTDRAQARDEGGDVDAGAPAPAPAAATPTCGESISWTPSSPVPIDILADSAVEFAGKIDQALGGNPHTSSSFSFTSDIQNNKMAAVNMTVETSIIRPRWSGGRPTPTEQALIKRVETFIKEHEERHRDITRSVAQQAVCDAKGKDLASAKAVLKKAICETDPTRQEALDNKEGKLTWVKDSTGAVTDFAPSGEKHDYHVNGCDPFGSAPPPADGQQAGDGGTP